MVNACVNPQFRASRNPKSTAAPLPQLRGSTNIRRAGSAAAICARRSAEPSVLPSTTTHTGAQRSSAARTVSNTFSPGL